MIPTPPLTANVTIAEMASALIRVFEGVSLTSYQDSGGVWTIGFGHTGPDVVKGMTITLPQAEGLLVRDEAQLFKMVEGRKTLTAAALVSFGYNCGAAALQRVLDGHATPTDFVHDKNKRVLPGLVARRHLEELLIIIGG